MTSLKSIFLCLVLCSVNGLTAQSFAGNQMYGSPQLVSAAEDTWTDSDYDNAEIALHAALLATEGDFNKQLPILQGLADTYHERQKYEEEKAVLLALILVMNSIDDYPLIPLAAQHLRLSTVYFAMEDYKNAASFAQTAVDIFKKSSRTESTNLALALNNLGWIELKQANLDLSLEHFEKSLSILRKTVGKKSLIYGIVSENLGALYTEKGNHRLAFKWYQTSLKTLDDYLTKDESLIIDILRRCNQARELSRTPREQRVSSSKSKKRLAGENRSQK